jgi:hypothetical protein
MPESEQVRGSKALHIDINEKSLLWPVREGAANARDTDRALKSRHAVAFDRAFANFAYKGVARIVGPFVLSVTSVRRSDDAIEARRYTETLDAANA